MPTSYSPAKEMRLRVLDARRRQVRPQRLHLRLQNDRKTHYDRVLFSRTKSGADKVADLARGRPWADVKVKIVGATTLDGKTGAFLVKVERLSTGPQAGPPLPHARHPRDRELAELDRRAGLHRARFEDYVAEKFPSRQAGDFAVLEAGHRLRGHLHRAGRLLGASSTTR